MHEDNHAEIVQISLQFSHRQTTNAISISYGFPKDVMTKWKCQAHRIGFKEWKKNIPIIPSIPLSGDCGHLRLAITDTLQLTQYPVPYPTDSLKFNADPGCGLLAMG
jgi:hypothetical protein